jgi:hypothetical protein
LFYPYLDYKKAYLLCPNNIDILGFYSYNKNHERHKGETDKRQKNDERTIKRKKFEKTGKRTESPPKTPYPSYGYGQLGTIDFAVQ